MYEPHERTCCDAHRSDGSESTDMHSLPHDAVDVLVVGAGVAGLATGLVLGQLGVSALVIERRTDWSSHPRATALTGATMELLRNWGVEPEVREAGFASVPVMSTPPQFGWPRAESHPVRGAYVDMCARSAGADSLQVHTVSRHSSGLCWELTGVQVGDDGVRVTLAGSVIAWRCARDSHSLSRRG